VECCNLPYANQQIAIRRWQRYGLRTRCLMA